MSYKIYSNVTRLINKCPYPIRWLYWTLLYYYNTFKGLDSGITLELYQSYALKKPQFRFVHNDVSGYKIFKNNKLVATFYITRHPDIPYEVFLKDTFKSKRVSSEEEAIQFILENE